MGVKEQLSSRSGSMINLLDALRSIPNARKFEIGDLLFARFSCPGEEEPFGVWSETDHLVHVLTSQLTWKMSVGTWSAAAGETVFFKRGAYLLPPHYGPELCFFLFLIPDGIVRDTVRELAADLPPVTHATKPQDVAIRVNNDAGLSAFFHAMALFFSDEKEPPRALLSLKLKELLTAILLSPDNPMLAAHLRLTATQGLPPLAPIMEANFHHRLSLDEFAQMCHRSLSSFKRDFQAAFGAPPGKWLWERRLQLAATLLQNTCMNITEVMLEAGFQDSSHFCRAFKQRFGLSPSLYRDASVVAREAKARAHAAHASVAA